MQHIHADRALGPEGWLHDVQIDVDADGRIAALGKQTQPATARVTLALPAPTNLHSHAFQRAMAGMTEARGPDPTDSFWTWRALMYRFLDQLTPEDIEAIAAQVYVEMLESGYGAVAEFHYLHHAVGGGPYAHLPEMAERVIAAATRTGIGLTLLPVLYEVGGCDQRPLAGGQCRFGNDPDRFARLVDATQASLTHGHPDYTLGIAPHSLRAVTPAGLDAAVALAADRPIHMHLAEQVAEVDEVVAHRGARPAEWLLDNQPVGERWCLIHCTQMTAQETTRLARSGAVAGLCPVTESNLGDGIFNGTDFLAAGGRIGVGSDSNVQITLFGELRTLEYSQRLRDRSRAALARPDQSTGRVIYDQACRGGARAAARAAGQIAPGLLADIVGLRTDTPWLFGRQGDDALDSLIFGARGRDHITDVWSAGRHVVRDGRHTLRDPVGRDFMATVRRLEQTA